MMKFKKLIVFCSILSNILLFSGLIQASDKNIQLRLNRLERMMDNNSPILILKKFNQLQRENQDLRSQLEEIRYQNDKLKTRFYSLIEDMDRRVLIIESEIIVVPDEQDKEKTTPASNADNFDNNTESQMANQTLSEEQSLIEQKAYQAAFNELKAQRYSKASESFSQFLHDYPESSYAHLAQYWLAESNYAQRNFKKAINDYTALINNYPNTKKKSEALLKIAYCYYELDNKKTAQIKLQQLIKQYPNSTEANQAKHLLKSQ
jgi:tol-pal system protein YbgF